MSPDSERLAWELHVEGLLGPTLLSAVPHDAVQHVPPHQVLVVEAEESELPRVLQRLVALGAEVESVRLVSPAAPRTT